MDNIDWQSPEVQELITTSLFPYSKLADTPFLLAMRPKTYLVNAVGALHVDKELHEGPRPYDVIKECIEKFLKMPNNYTKGTIFESPENEAEAFEIMTNLRELIRKDDIFEEFVNNLFGDNKRASLSSMHVSVKIKERIKMYKRNITPHLLNRLLVRLGQDYYQYDKNPYFENLFYCEGGKDEYLIKTRLLTYLCNCGKEKVRLKELVGHLKMFDYPKEMISIALNQLLTQIRQLILSNTRNHYNSDEFEIRGDDLISITKAGEGYINYGIKSFDYISEIIVDCYVDEKDFNIQENVGMRGRFDATREFINILGILELKEINGFLNNSENIKRDGKKDYMAIYGNTFITYEMRKHIVDAMRNIYYSLMSNTIYEIEEWEEIPNMEMYNKQLHKIIERMRNDQIIQQENMSKILDMELNL
jgi:hypothetical protein